MLRLILLVIVELGSIVNLKLMQLQYGLLMVK